MVKQLELRPIFVVCTSDVRMINFTTLHAGLGLCVLDDAAHVNGGACVASMVRRIVDR
jgi:hypothetical protein